MERAAAMEDESLTNVGSPESPCLLNKANANKEQDRFLPVANVGRIMKKVLPTSGKISKDAKETVQECVSEFISFVTGEASDKCQREKRKTINGDDVIWAITTLGFEDYAAPLKAYLNKYRDTEGDRVNVPINRHSQRMQLLQQQQHQQEEEAGNIDLNNNINDNDMNYSCCSDDNNNGVYSSSSSYMGSVGCDHYHQKQPLLPAFTPTSIYHQQQQQQDQVNSLGQW